MSRKSAMEDLIEALRPDLKEIEYKGKKFKVSNPGKQIFLMQDLLDACGDYAKRVIMEAGIGEQLKQQPPDLDEWRRKVKEEIAGMKNSIEDFDENDISPEQAAIWEKMGLNRPENAYESACNKIKNRVFLQWYYTLSLHDSESGERICETPEDFVSISKIMNDDLIKIISGVITSKANEALAEKNANASDSSALLLENQATE